MIVMSAGPTLVPQNVRDAMVSNFTNTDLDKEYIKFHRNVEKKISKLLNTDSLSFTMLGEAMLGLDGACASFISPNDRVLVLSNGIFSHGFKDFALMYGGFPVVLEFDDRRGLDVEKLKSFLEKDSDFKIATLVHCETPYGISSDISKICPVLSEYGIISIVDSVSGMGGEKINFDLDKIDCLIGGTQKCLSAPAGLTTITLSKKAIEFLQNRKTTIPSFYGNFLNYIKKDGFEFPYTPCDNLIYALNTALDNTLDHDFVKRHKNFADATRFAMKESGLELYAKDSHSNTVTTIYMPEGKSSEELLSILNNKGYILSGGMGKLHDKAFRIGHMGNNISDLNLYKDMLGALNDALLEMGITLKRNLLESFIESFTE